MTVAPHFDFKDGVLHAENVPVTTLAQEFGTPLYVYSRQALHDAWESYRSAIGDRNVLVCFGMKANSNLAVLNEFKKLGSGFDIVSGGELARVLAIGGDPAKIVFSGVGKQVWEIQAALKAGVKCFNVESEGELLRLAEVAEQMGTIAPVSLRVNPDVDAQSHPHISTGMKRNKFGVPLGDARALLVEMAARPGLEVVGIHVHVGSQITTLEPLQRAAEKMVQLAAKLLKSDGIALEHLDLGGGLGISYTGGAEPDVEAYAKVVSAAANATGLSLIVEPGRWLVGNAGALLGEIIDMKPAPDDDAASPPAQADRRGSSSSSTPG